MTWLTVTEYLYHKWPEICSICPNHNPVLSSFMTYHWACNKSSTTSATCGSGTAANSSRTPEFTSSPPIVSGVRVVLSLVFCVMLVDRCLSFCPFFLWHCIVCSFFNVRLLISPLVFFIVGPIFVNILGRSDFTHNFVFVWYIFLK